MIMDLNYLLQRQQVERSRADAAQNEAARAAHEELAKQYEERIEEITSEGFQFPRED
jgi:predicted Zn-dependent peptidase